MNRTIRKTLAGLLCLALVLSLLPALAVPANAAAPRLTYELSVADAADPHNVSVIPNENGSFDPVLITMTVHFPDGAPYVLSYMQDEILLDGGFFYGTGSRGTGNLIDVSFVQFLGTPMVKLSTMSKTLSASDAAVASFYLTPQKGLAVGTSITLRNGSVLCYDTSGQRYSISTQDLTITVGSRPVPTSTVTYDTAGGEMDPTAFPDIDAGTTEDDAPYYAKAYPIGDDIALPDVQPRENYKFLGWLANGTTYAAGASYTVPSSDVTFVAQWQAYPTVTFNLNGGTMSDAARLRVEPNSGVKLPTPTKANSTFLGWSDGNNIVTGTYLVGADDVTFTAQWAQHYTLTLNPGEGTLSGSGSVTAPAGESVSLPSATREGYQFSGWSDGSAIYGASFTMPAGSTTLTAQWTENPTLLLDVNGGTMSDATARSTAPNTTVSLPIPTRTGYIFGGWSDGSRSYTSSYTLGTTNTTLKAVWTECAHAGAVYAKTGETDWTHVAGSHTHTRTVTSTATCPVCRQELVKTETETADCSYGSGWSITADTHAHICTVCKDVTDSAAHTYDGNGVCTVCGFENPKMKLPVEQPSEIKPSVSVSGNTATVGNISVSALEQAAGNGNASDPIVMDMTAYGGTVANAVLSAETLSRIAALDTADGLELTLSQGSLALTAQALETITASAGGDVTISLTTGEVSTLSSAQQSAVKNMKVTTVISATVMVDGKAVTNFGGGVATVTIPFTLADNTEYDVYYVSPSGALERMLTFYGDGKLSFMTSHFSDYVVAGEGSVASVTPTTRFVDVATGAYYADAVQWAVEKGITNGTDDTHFSPDAGCTRAQAVTFLYRAAGSPDVSVSDSFRDVPANQYYAKAVAWAVANGITNGTGDKTFSPDATCTRAQIVTFLMRYEKAAAASASKFADVSADAYYAGAVGWAVTNGITNGTGDNTFSPDATCTRAQIVTFLYRDFVKA